MTAVVDATSLVRLAKDTLRTSEVDCVGIYTFGRGGMHGVNLGLPDDFTKLYERIGIPIDPVLRRMRESGSPCSSSTVLGADWERSELYLRVSSHFGFRDYAGLPLYDLTDLVGILFLGVRTAGESSLLGPESLCRLSVRATQISTALKAMPLAHPGLTPRQDSVARLAAAGLSNRDIADSLGTGEAAVRKHLKSLNLIFGTTNRTAMAAIWRQSAR